MTGELAYIHIENCYFEANSGIPLPAFCPNCGPSFGFCPIGSSFGTLRVSGTTTNCQICGSRAQVAEGDYKFATWVHGAVEGALLTRQQKRRFIYKASKAKDLEKFAETAGLINPELGKVAREIVRQRDPWKALRTAIMVIGASLTATAGLLAGAESALNLHDRLRRDNVPQLEHQLHGNERNEEPEDKKHNKDLNEDPDNPSSQWGRPIEI